MRFERGSANSNPWSSLPPEADGEGESVQRLGRIGFFLAMAGGLSLVVRHVSTRFGWHFEPDAARLADRTLIAMIALCLVVAGLTRWSRLRDRTLMRLGAALEVTLVFGLSFIERLLFSFGSAAVPLSTAVVFFLGFPIALPHSRRRRYLTSGLAVLAMPLGNLLASALANPITDYLDWIARFTLSWLVALIGLGLWRIVHEMGKALHDAKQMGPYELRELLGKGGMGEVWAAEHQLLARPAAVKLIRAQPLGSSSEAILARFTREARATAELRSPHTVELFDFGRSPDGTFYYVMELLDGIDLNDCIEHFGPMPPSRVMHILMQACASLEEAHQVGLVHRDIKPANLFLCHVGAEFDFVKVLDFGLVKPLDLGLIEGETKPAADPRSVHESDPAHKLLTRLDSVIGTPAFMAPEQALGLDVGPATDIYALGCVAYWLLTGETVFEGDDPAVQMLAHATLAPSFGAAQSQGRIPAALIELLLACLAKSPVDRPRDAEELRRRLKRVRLDDEWSEEDARAWWLAQRPEELSRAARNTYSAQQSTPPPNSSERVTAAAS